MCNKLIVLFKSKLIPVSIIVFLLAIVNSYSLAINDAANIKTNIDDKCADGLTKNGVTIYIVRAISANPVLPETNRADLDVDGCLIDVDASKNEYESASFVINSSLDIDNGIDIVVSDLKNGNNIIHKNTIDIKSVKVWYQAAEAWREIARVKSAKSGSVRLVPELLLNDEDLVQVDHKNSINLIRIKKKNNNKFEYLKKDSKEKNRKSIINLSPDYVVSDSSYLKPIGVYKNKNKQIWITFHVSSEAVSGVYRGNVTLLSNNMSLIDIPIELNVSTYELPEPKLEYGIYYHGRLHSSGEASLSSEYKSSEQLRFELQDMYQYGFKNPVIYQHHYKDKNKFKEYMSIRDELGIDNKRLYLMWLNTNKVGSHKEIERLKNDIEYVKSIVKEFGTSEIYVYGRDEAKGEKLIEQKEAWELIRSNDVKVYVAGYRGTYEAIGKELDLFVLAKSPMPDEAEKFHSIGHKIFNYANPQSGVENPYIYRRNYGLVLWSSGFDGALVYAYQHSMGDAWNDSDHYLFRDHNFTYPTSNGAIKTLAWEGMREAIDDVRYLTLLKTEINKFSASTNINHELVIKAEKYLDSMSSKVLKYSRHGKYTDNFSIDLYEFRRNVKNHIEELKQLNSKN